MAITTKQLGIAYSHVQHGADAEGVLRCLVIESLSPNQRLVYEMLTENESLVSATVAKEYSWSASHAANILKHLHNMGLASMEIVKSHGGGVQYIWKQT